MSRRNLRVLQAAALVATGALALSACGSSGGSNNNTKPNAAADYSYGTIPAASSNVVPGGTLHIAEDIGAQPNWIMPLTPAANSSVYDQYQFQYLSWRSLFWSPKGSTPDWDYSRSMTDGKPTVSADGKTFTIKLNGKYTWSDGQKVTSKDVLFWYYEYKAAVKESPANMGNYTVGQFPDNVTAVSAPDDQTVTFTFNQVLNPDWVLGTEFSQIVPMPAHAWAKSSDNGSMLDYTQPANAKAIYDYLSAASKKLDTYQTNPLWQVVDGPYKISMYNTSTGAANFVANKNYTGEGKPNIAEIDELAYTSPTAEFNDLQSGKLDFGYVKSDNYPQLGKLKTNGYNVYGLPSFGFNFSYFNFKNTTGGWDKAVAQLYIRQAFAHLQDEDAEIKGVFKGLAAPAYGPLGVAPKSPYTPESALTNPFPFSVDTAKQLLTSHGWTVVPNGTTTCTSPGTAANQCGAGITKGQNLDFTLFYTSTPKSVGQMMTAFAANLKQIGVNVTLKTDTFNNIVTNESVVSTPKNNNNWGMADFGGFTESIYPSTINLFNTGGSYNQGGFSDPTLDKLINNSMVSPDSNALKNEITAVDADLPGLFQPNEDRVYAWSPKLSGSTDSFAAATQFMLNPEDWYFTK
ncbi:ABC transporter substrate-binding protein [Streptacidiphilus neutrinimicus]|uniref:ABC transporter substrate-binding protein n=1 Tax=Streptacidiphilus neutrinimicus TaxID=105420 RepID=UPI000A0133E0|nr:ABC transporter substrate-binding protein [Streptacidiphilus neutrinimicus]